MPCPRWTYDSQPALGRALRHPAAEALPEPDPATVEALAARLDATARVRLGRSLALRHVPTGGCNACELELHALAGVLYGLERLGLRFVGSPAEADVLLVTGPLTRTLREALDAAYAATSDPKWVVALGDCAVDGGVFKGSYAVEGGIGAAVPVDLVIRGCPPPPAQILAGLAALVAVNASARPIRRRRS